MKTLFHQININFNMHRALLWVISVNPIRLRSRWSGLHHLTLLSVCSFCKYSNAVFTHLVSYETWCTFFFAFRVTVAQGYKEYWVKSPGPVVSQNGVAPPPQTTFGGSIGAQTTTSSILSHSVSQTMLKLLKWQFTHCHEFVTLSVSKQL